MFNLVSKTLNAIKKTYKNLLVGFIVLFLGYPRKKSLIKKNIILMVDFYYLGGEEENGRSDFTNNIKESFGELDQGDGKFALQLIYLDKEFNNCTSLMDIVLL